MKLEYRPPRRAAFLLSVLLPRADHHEVLGDLEEDFTSYLRQHGLVPAQRWYWQATLMALPRLLLFRFTRRSPEGLTWKIRCIAFFYMLLGVSLCLYSLITLSATLALAGVLAVPCGLAVGMGLLKRSEVARRYVVCESFTIALLLIILLGLVLSGLVQVTHLSATLPAYEMLWFCTGWLVVFLGTLWTFHVLTHDATISIFRQDTTWG